MTRPLGFYTDEYGEQQHHSHVLDTADCALFAADARAGEDGS